MSKSHVTACAAIRSLSSVQQLVSVDVLGPGKLFATDIAGIAVVRLGAVSLNMLGQLGHLVEVLTTLNR